MTDLDSERVREGATYAASWIAYQRAVRDIPGAVFGVRWNDDEVFLSACGRANIERDVPMTTDHIFRIASHSKTFTAVSLMQLAEAGKLRLDDSLGAHISWLRGAVAEATVRQAMNHAAGVIRDGADTDHWHLARPFPNVDQLRALVEDGGDVLPPNERFKYSNIAYSLLGQVIESASGASYQEYTRSHIVEPLGLKNMGPETDDHAREGLVTGYTARWPNIERVPFADVTTGAMAAATGFYSTCADLLRYASSHFMGNEEILSDRSKREMQQPFWAVGDGSFYGLGMAVKDVGARRLVGHGGGFPGHTTLTLIDSHSRLASVVMMNQSGGPAHELGENTVKIIDLALSQGAPTADEAGRLDRFTGRFWSTWGPTDIVRFGDALLLLAPESGDPTQDPGRLTVVDDATLRIEVKSGTASPGESIRYERDGAGEIALVRVAGGSHFPEAIFRERLADTERIGEALA